MTSHEKGTFTKEGVIDMCVYSSVHEGVMSVCVCLHVYVFIYVHVIVLVCVNL